MTGMDAEPDPRRWKALWVCLVAGFMTLLDVSIVNVALPSIQTGLQATPQLFRGAERGRAFGLLGATIGISTAVGPVVGGVILNGLGEQTSWRWIFIVNLPIAVAAVLLAMRWLPD